MSGSGEPSRGAGRRLGWKRTVLSVFCDWQVKLRVETWNERGVLWKFAGVNSSVESFSHSFKGIGVSLDLVLQPIQNR